jgi:hypothetical protein
MRVIRFTNVEVCDALDSVLARISRGIARPLRLRLGPPQPPLPMGPDGRGERPAANAWAGHDKEAKDAAAQLHVRAAI